MRPWLITADIHLSDRPKDEYRFGLFGWLLKQQKLHDVEAIFILGDITQEKDKHSSTLVNRTIDEITGLKPPVYVVRGNHDGIDPDNPFFKFLNYIEGIIFAVEPTYVKSLNVGLIPHCTSQNRLESACYGLPYNPKAIMCHQTFDGAVAETGIALSGLSALPIEYLKPGAIYAGDVHRPQTLGAVTYVGAPYPVRFGDDFRPRVLLVADETSDLHFPCPRKWALTVDGADELANLAEMLKFRAHDQVKLTVRLSREKAVDWLTQRREIINMCKSLDVDVYGIELKVEAVALPKIKDKTTKSNSSLLEAFCKAEKVPDLVKEAGLAILGE